MDKIKCTLAEMIERDLVPGNFIYEGFTIGKKGKQMFWHYNPTPNGFYKIYPQYENGEIGHPRYVDAKKTNVVVHPKLKPLSPAKEELTKLPEHIIEDIIWYYKQALNVEKTKEIFAPIITEWAKENFQKLSPALNVEDEPLKTHQTFVIGFGEKDEIVFFKSYDYTIQKDKAQSDLKWVIDNCKAWEISAASEWTLRNVEGDFFKINIPHP